MHLSSIHLDISLFFVETLTFKNLFTLSTWSCVFFIRYLLKTPNIYESHNPISSNWTKYSWGLSVRSIFVFQWSLTQLSSEENFTIAQENNFVFSSFDNYFHFWSIFTKMPAFLWQLAVLNNDRTQSRVCLPFLFCLRICL